MQSIYIAAEHAGFSLKSLLREYISSLGYKVFDLGSKSDAPTDYPDFAKKLCRKLQGSKKKGILICGTGIGMSISANKFSFIRAALCTNVYEAKMSRQHNDANVLCLGGRVIGEEFAKEIVKVWLESKFSGEERHKRRIKKINTS